MRLKGGLTIPIADTRYVNVDGDKMTGDLDMSSKQILNALIDAGSIISGVLNSARIPITGAMLMFTGGST